MSAFTARYSKPKLILYGVGALAFVGAGALLVTRPAATLGMRWFGLLAVLFFGVCAIAVARRLFDSGHVLLINEAGLFDRRATDRMVPWPAVADIREARVRNQRFYALELSQPLRQFVDDRYKRMLLGLNRPWVRNGIFVNASGLSASHEEIGIAMRRYWKGAAGQSAAQ